MPVASRTRCRSPPLSVSAARSSVRYSVPTRSRNASRRTNFGDDRFGNRPLVVGERELAEELDRVGDGERRDFVDGEAAEAAGAGFGPQARAVAVGARSAERRMLRIESSASSERYSGSLRSLQPSSLANSQPMTRRARTVRAVEAERPRFDFADARPAARAGVARVEQPLLPRLVASDSPLWLR